MAYTPYTTKDGDRWDTIAFNAYGTLDKVDYEGRAVNAMALIIEENLSVVLDRPIPAGTPLKIPIVDKLTIENDILPIWR